MVWSNLIPTTAWVSLSATFTFVDAQLQHVRKEENRLCRLDILSGHWRRCNTIGHLRSYVTFWHLLSNVPEHDTHLLLLHWVKIRKWVTAGADRTTLLTSSFRMTAALLCQRRQGMLVCVAENGEACPSCCTPIISRPPFTSVTMLIRSRGVGWGGSFGLTARLHGSC